MGMKACLRTPGCGNPPGLPPHFSVKNVYWLLVLLSTAFYVTGSASKAGMREGQAVNLLPYSRGSSYASQYRTTVEAEAESAETRTAGLDAEEDESYVSFWREAGAADVSAAVPAKGRELRPSRMSSRPQKRQKVPGTPEDERSPRHRKRFSRKWVVGGILVTAVVAMIVARIRANRKLHDMMREKQAAAASEELLHLLRQVQAAYDRMSASQKKDFHFLMEMVIHIAERAGEDGEVADLVLAVTSGSPAKVEEYVRRNLEGLSPEKQKDIRDIVRATIPVLPKVIMEHF